MGVLSQSTGTAAESYIKNENQTSGPNMKTQREQETRTHTGARRKR